MVAALGVHPPTIYMGTFGLGSALAGLAGALALGSPSERFHWLTAPRSDVIQSGPVHEGVCADPAREIETLFRELVRP